MKSRLILFLLLFNQSEYLNAQMKDYFIVDGDTTFCTNLKFRSKTNNTLKRMTYIDSNGVKVELRGKKNIPVIETRYQDEYKIESDRIPQKADKPDSYYMYAGRAVDGKLKVYLHCSTPRTTTTYTNYPNSSMGYFKESTTGGGCKFIIKMPDGTFYNIYKKSDMDEHIIPYLVECEAFKEAYKGDFSKHTEPFKEMIRLYNSLCIE